jgi:hypothetical protein
MPSNSLAVLHSLVADVAARQALGPGTAIDITPIDETNTRVKIRGIIALLRRAKRAGHWK